MTRVLLKNFLEISIVNTPYLIILSVYKTSALYMYSLYILFRTCLNNHLLFNRIMILWLLFTNTTKQKTIIIDAMYLNILKVYKGIPRIQNKIVTIDKRKIVLLS